MRASTQKGKRALYIAAGLCLALAAFLKFCLLGYGMSALAFLGLAACLGFFGLMAGRRGPGARRLKLIVIIVLLIGVACFLAAEIPVLMDCRSDADTTAPYLIVCGAGVHGSTPSLSMTDRLREAMAWLDAEPAGKAVLTGAQGPGEDLSEAQAMFDWLTARGVDPGRLILEDQAVNSLQNLRYSLERIAADGGDPAGRVAILSSEYHLHRLGWMAERLGCQPVLVAARTTKISLFINYAVREAFAMWKLWVFGL